MDFNVAKAIFESLYSGVDGYNISSKARKNLPYASKAHTYGEVTPDGFKKVLSDAKAKPGGIFYDLGSGTGKAVMLAALLGKFPKLVGIEIIKELYQVSINILGRFDPEVRPILPVEKQKQTIEFVNADFLEYDFSDADVVFTHATCFYDELMVALERKCATLKKGTKVLLVTKNFQSPLFRLIKSGEYPMTWGKATVNFYEKVE
ncbi:SAM-dependent methyltransferase [Candidatus Roizmanbacteria bacterium]|nr:SAM-dependent methyltransferase [Candidatus Roizmanbacteria bacterium]